LAVVRHFVVGVHYEDGVQLLRGQLGIFRLAEDNFDLWERTFLDAPAQLLKDVRHDVNRIHLPLQTDGSGKTNREETLS